MRILVTGATGFLGSHLVRALLKEGHEVLAYHRESSNFHRLDDIQNKIRWFNLDRVSLSEPFQQQPIDIDAILHLATLYDQPETSDQSLIATNVLLPRQLIELAKQNQVPLFVNTDSFYSKAGNQIGYQTRYVQTKRQCLEELKKEAGSVKVINFRLEHVYGEDDGLSKFLPWVTQQLLHSVPVLPLTPGDQRRDFIYVADVVQAFLVCLQESSKLSESFLEIEVGHGQSVPLRSAVELLHKLTNSTTHLAFGTQPHRPGEIMESHAHGHWLLERGWRTRIDLEEGFTRLIVDIRRRKSIKSSHQTQPMHILVTGGTGFLGSHVCRALLKEGHHILAYYRDKSSFERVTDIKEKIQWFNLDQTKIESPFQTKNGVNAIIHIATCYGRSSESISDLISSNVLFPIKLLELCSKFNVETFFNTDTCLDPHLNAYSLTKHQFLNWLQQDKSNTHIINLRLQHLYGPGDDSSKFVTKLIHDCLENRPVIPLTKGEQQRDFFYVQDAVDSYVHFLKQDHRPKVKFWSVNIGSGQSIQVSELAKLVHHLTKSSSKLCFGDLPYRVNEMMYAQADLATAREWGWSPHVELEVGLSKSIAAERLKKGYK